MSPVDFVGLLIPVTYLVLLGVETLFPARPLPEIRLWRLQGIGFLLVFGAIATSAPLLIPEAWLARHRLVDLSGLGVIAGTIIGYLALTLISYIWHRAAHASPLLWRVFHQMHHAPQRIDVSSANLFHPLEIVVFAVLGTLTTVFLLGLDPLAAALVNYLTGFNAFFQHMNVRTPRWVGFIIQRPEAHSVHHQRDVHDYNFSDLALWDMLFGTYRNPAGFAEETGFDTPAARRLGAMLAFVDVNAGERGPANLGRPTPSPR